MADLLEEGDWAELPFCCRWMAWYGRRPGW
jgi:hypothetical protein